MTGAVGVIVQNQGVPGQGAYGEGTGNQRDGADISYE
jgi:hypothetical protein